MKKIAVVFIGSFVCTPDILGSLPPSRALAGSQKSTMVSIAQDRATATTSVDFSPTINLIQTQMVKETDPSQLAFLNQQLQQTIKLQQEQIALQREKFEYQKAKDAEAREKAEAEENARKAAERERMIAERQAARERDAAFKKFLNCKRIAEEADNGKYSRPYNPCLTLDREMLSREIKSKKEIRNRAVREATALSLKWGFSMFDVKEKK